MGAFSNTVTNQNTSVSAAITPAQPFWDVFAWLSGAQHQGGGACEILIQYSQAASTMTSRELFMVLVSASLRALGTRYLFTSHVARSQSEASGEGRKTTYSKIKVASEGTSVAVAQPR
jgi:hypothetical protein